MKNRYGAIDQVVSTDLVFEHNIKTDVFYLTRRESFNAQGFLIRETRIRICPSSLAKQDNAEDFARAFEDLARAIRCDCSKAIEGGGAAYDD